MTEFLSQYGSPMDALFAFIALIYLITVCLCFDSRKRTQTTQVFLIVLNVLLVFCSYLTSSVFLLVMWLICLFINGSILRDMRNSKED